MSTISVLQARVSQLKIEGIEWVERALRPARESVSNQPAGASTTDVVRVAQGDDLSRITASQPSTPQLSLYSSPSSPQALRARPGNFADLLGIDGGDVVGVVAVLGMLTVGPFLMERRARIIRDLCLAVEQHEKLNHMKRGQIELDRAPEKLASDLIELEQEIELLRISKGMAERGVLRDSGWDANAIKGELAKLRAALASARGVSAQLRERISRVVLDTELPPWVLDEQLGLLRRTEARIEFRLAEIAKLEAELAEAEAKQNARRDDDNEPPTAGAGGGSVAGGPVAVTVVGTSNSFEALEAQVSNAEVAAALRAEAEAQSVANPLPFAFTRGMAVPSPVELNVLGIRFSLTPARPVPGRVRLVPL